MLLHVVWWRFEVDEGEEEKAEMRTSRLTWVTTRRIQNGFLGRARPDQRRRFPRAIRQWQGWRCQNSHLRSDRSPSWMRLLVQVRVCVWVVEQGKTEAEIYSMLTLPLRLLRRVGFRRFGSKLWSESSLNWMLDEYLVISLRYRTFDIRESLSYIKINYLIDW